MQVQTYSAWQLLTLNNVVRSFALIQPLARHTREPDLERALGSVGRVRRCCRAEDVDSPLASLADVVDADGAVVVEPVLGVDARAVGREGLRSARDLEPAAGVLGQVGGEENVCDGICASAVVEGRVHVQGSLFMVLSG